MKRQRLRKILFITIGMAVILTITVFCFVEYTSTRMTEFSFNQLKEMTKDEAEEYKETIETNYSILGSIASMLAMVDFSDTQKLTAVLNSFDYGESYISFQLLMPDNRLLDQSGQWTDVSERADFAEVVGKVPYLSGRCTDLLNSDMPVMHQAVPVVREGETAAILVGVFSLQEASRIYKLNEFEGNAFVLLVDGQTGDVLVDTWHDSLGNLQDYSDRDFKLGDTVLEAMEKMKCDMSGNLAFISETRGKTIYIRCRLLFLRHWPYIL